MKTPVDTVELIAGQGLSVEFDMVGLKGAELMPQDVLWDQFNVPLNRENYLLTPLSEVAIKTTDDQEGPVLTGTPELDDDYLGDWVGLGSHSLRSSDWTYASTKEVYPSFAWFVPFNAKVGDKLYAGMEVKDASRYWYGVFEVKVVNPPAEEAVEEEEEEEGRSLLYTLFVVTLTVGILAGSAYLFLI